MSEPVKRKKSGAENRRDKKRKEDEKNWRKLLENGFQNPQQCTLHSWKILVSK